MRESSVVQSYMEEAKTQGLQEGRQEGTEQAYTKIAITMLNDNQPIDTIVKYTGLAKAEIEQLTTSARSST